MRKLLVGLLTVALIMAACAKPSKPRLKWNGSGLEGLTFVERELPEITVHYALPTTPDVAEHLANKAVLRVKDHIAWRRLAPSARLHVWVVPAGENWPDGLSEPLAGRLARAGAPGVVVTRADDTGNYPGFSGEVAIALTQPATSPAYQVDWLRAGLGKVLAESYNGFPVKHWKVSGNVVDAAGSMENLKNPAAAGPDRYEASAGALAALLMDRWGINFAVHYPEAGGDWTPEAALRWATGKTDPAEAVRLWQERMEYLNTEKNLTRSAYPDVTYQATAADMSPIRVQPALKSLPKGPGPMSNYSPHSYEIAARYEPGQRQVTGDLKLTWKNGESIPVDTLYFNLWPNAEQYALFGGAITVQNVAVNGRPTAHTAQYLDLSVPLGRPVAHGEQVVVTMQFATTLPSRITMRVFGQENGRFNLAHWFPILAVLDDRGWNLTPLPTSPGEPYSETAQFRVTLDVPGGTLVGATGRPTRTETGDRWIYSYDAPNVRDWAAIGGTGLVEVTRVVDGITIRAIDGDRKWAEAQADETAKAMRFFNERFGRYGYSDLVVACCAGLEYPGLFYTYQLDSRGQWKRVTYHELVHQWFYAMVGNDQWSEPWLDEGFTRYGERLGVRLLAPNNPVTPFSTALSPSLRVTSSSARYGVTGQYAVGVYNRGALVLEDLEEMLGEEEFGRLIREWVARYQFKTATSADFVSLAEEISNRDLAPFFAEHGVDPYERAPYRPTFPLGKAIPEVD